MAAWPEDVPVVAAGQELGQDPDVQRTPFDDGAVRQERVYTSAWRTRAVTALIGSDDALEAFRAWAAADAHRLFDVTVPETGTAARARVRGGAAGIAYRSRVVRGVRDWEADLVLEGPAA